MRSALLHRLGNGWGKHLDAWPVDTERTVFAETGYAQKHSPLTPWFRTHPQSTQRVVLRHDRKNRETGEKRYAQPKARHASHLAWIPRRIARSIRSNPGGVFEHHQTVPALAGTRRWRRPPARRRPRRHPHRWRLAAAAELATPRTRRDAGLRPSSVDRRLGERPPPCSRLSACLACSARVPARTAVLPALWPVSPPQPSPQRHQPNRSATMATLGADGPTAGFFSENGPIPW